MIIGMQQTVQQTSIWDICTAVGTIAMAIVSAITLYRLYKSNQAKLVATISVHISISDKGEKKKFWCLDISNIGHSTAYNIKLRMDKTFIKSLPIKTERRILKDLMNRTFIINPQELKIYPLCPISASINEYTKDYKIGEYKEIVDDWLEDNYDEPFFVELKYNTNWRWERYTFTLRDYDTRGAIFNEDDKTIKVEIVNEQATNEKH